MRKAFLFAFCFAGAAALVACGSNLTSAPDGGPDTGQERDGTILVEAHAPDAGRDAHAPPPDGNADAKPTDATVDGHARDGAADGGSPEAEAEAATDAATDGATDVATDAVGDAPADIVSVDVAPPPDASSCLPESPNAYTGLFVVAGGSLSGACGTLVTPCGSLDVAIGVASAAPSVTTIYVGPGTFSSATPIALPGGLAIVGGWNVVKTTWTHDCMPPLIEGPSPVFTATSLTSPATLDTLDVVETTVAAPGVSLYGITSLDSALTLTNVSITVNAGGPGDKGTTIGAKGKAGASTGCSPGGDGGSGIPGDAGAPTSAGSFGPPPGCFVSAVDGKSGVAGGPGRHGILGGYGAKDTNYDCTFSGSCMTVSTNQVEGGTGVGGCGGAGGKGGSPGTGGGCSIGIYVWGGSVTLTGGTITTGAGGTGGGGAGGGDGGAGAAGVGGKSVSYLPGCSTDPYPPRCLVSMKTAAGGDAGGPGGPGATGGQGGGGAGGCSFAYYVGTGATVTPTGVTFLPGAGGPGGTPNGVAGPSGDHN